MDTNSVLLRFSSGTLLLSGEFAARELPKLAATVGLHAPLAALRTKVEDRYSDEFVAFVELLLSRSLISEDGSRSSAPGWPHWRGQGRSARDFEDALAASRVGIVGSGIIAETVRAALVRDGIACGTVSEAGSPSFLRDFVAGQTLVIICSDDMSLAGYDELNEACHQEQVPWTSARIDRRLGLIGPYVVPGQTACFACFELRARANCAHPGDHAALASHWRQRPLVSLPSANLPEFAEVLGSMVALDTHRVVLGGALSAAFGRLLTIDLQTLHTDSHEILKLPRCPVCSRTRETPQTRIWDLHAHAAP